jgi:hypothetical protein
MDPIYTAAYILTGILVSLFIDAILWAGKLTPLTNWQKSFAILLWPIILLNLYLNDND